MISKEQYKEDHAFYQSKAWRQSRLLRLQMDKRICQECGGAATEVHHVIERKMIPEGVDPMDHLYGMGNLISLCKSCHSRHTYEERLKGAYMRTKELEIYNKKWKI